MTGKKGGATKAAASAGVAVDDPALDKILIDNASGKDEKGLKSFAVRNDDIKANSAYMQAVVRGQKLTELEESGGLVKNPDDGTYI